MCLLPVGGSCGDRTFEAVSTVIHCCGMNNVIFNAIEHQTDRHISQVTKCFFCCN